MAIYLYIRASDDRQSIDTQRFQLKKFLKKKSIDPKDAIWFEVTGLSAHHKSRKERKWDDLVSLLKPGDHVVVSDIARIGRRTTHETLNVITDITSKSKATLHIVRGNLTLVDSNDIASLFIALGKAYAAVEEAIANSERQKAAITRRKNDGLPVGRIPGTLVESKLDKSELQIRDMLEAGISKTKIAKRFKVARGTLYNWIKRGGNIKRKQKEQTKLAK